MTEFNGTPFQYNPAITNVNIDNQLAAILANFEDDYIIDVVKDSIAKKFDLYALPKPNVVAAYESTFKQLTDGYSSNTDQILFTRRRVYENIINVLCDSFNLEFHPADDTDYYSAAYWLYDFLVSRFTENLKLFYVTFMIDERAGIDSALNLVASKKDTDVSFGYSRMLFKDPKIAAIHSNVEYIVSQIGSFGVISLPVILNTVYAAQSNLPQYINSLITDNSGMFFNNYYQNYTLHSRESSDLLTYIKLALQEIGAQIEPVM